MRRAFGAASVVEGLERRVLLSRATGIDVSQFQGTINWAQVVASGVNYAYIRASYGQSSVDPNFTTNATNAVAAGMPIGFYHYAYYDLANHTPASEANDYWNAIKPYIKANGKYLMPMLDLEEGSALGTGTGVSNLSQWAEAWCTDIINDAAAVGLHVVPMIYCSSSPAGSYFDGTPPKSIPLWVADYTGTTTPQTSQPTAGTGDWQTWQMWQYSSSGSISGISGNVDVDVLNGDTTTLKDYLVSSSTGTPSGKWSANSTIQTTTGVNAYATVADAANQTSNFTAVASGSVGTITSGPNYAGSYQRWKVTFKNGATGYVGEDFMTTAAAPAAVALSSPANNAHLTSQPGTLTWTASPLATSYGVYLNGTLQTTTTATSYTLAALADGTYTWQVKAINSQGTAAGSTFSFVLDTTPPTATLPAQSPTGGSSTFQFTVNYADATAGVNSSTLGNGNISVTSPGGFTQAATFVTYNASTGVATYQITAPGGIWNAAANGTYTVLQNASSVKDNFGNARPAGAIGAFIANTFAYLSGTTLIVDYGDGVGSISLSSSGGNFLVQQGSNTDTFGSASVSAITVSGSQSGDTFTVGGTMTPPVTLDLSGGGGTINVNAGKVSVANDVTTDSPGLTLNVAAGAEVDFTTGEGLAALSIDGGEVTLNPSASTILNISGDLSITSGGTMDLGAGQLLAPSTSDLATYIAQAAGPAQPNGLNAWTGAGLTSSLVQADAANGNAKELTLGYFDSRDNGNTGLSVPAGQTLVKATVYGDATGDGKVSIADLSVWNNNFGAANPRWSQGDFNYDGKVNIADLSVWDNDFGNNVASSGPGPSVVTAATSSVGTSTPRPAAVVAEPSASLTAAGASATASVQGVAAARVVASALPASSHAATPPTSESANLIEADRLVATSGTSHRGNAAGHPKGAGQRTAPSDRNPAPAPPTAPAVIGLEPIVGSADARLFASAESVTSYKWDNSDRAAGRPPWLTRQDH